MHIPIVLAFVVLQCTPCLNIRVPVDWGEDSEVHKNEQLINVAKNEEANTKPASNEYFQYPAKKPQFAINIAAANGAHSPENHYISYPIRPHTSLPKLELGEHRVQDSEKIIVRPIQGFIESTGGSSYARPASTSFEVFHPYKFEEPALQQLYKDPILDNIRNDLRDSNNKLQKYHNAAGESDITKDEYLERPEQIDRKKQPQKNIPTQYEVHRPQRRPVYYRYPPKQNNREHIVNQKLRHPWNQHIAKVTPIHYRPIQHHLHGLRQQHALKFDDERNEYPQLVPHEDDEVKPESYDIYEKGRTKFVNLRDHVDNTINKVVQENRLHDGQNLEALNEQRDDHNSASDEADEEEFVPVKNYAQVRKTEITKHLPREAALQDAENFEEIENAPRLREAIKSKKAQIVYSEEGYEDSAYDHAGEQKQASDHERHGGYLKENEISKGKYKTPSLDKNYESSKGSVYKDQILHGEKWKNDTKENQDENESDYYESEEGESDVSEQSENGTNDDNDRNKRSTEVVKKVNNKDIDKKLPDNSNLQNKRQDFAQHEVIKRETPVVATEQNLNDNFNAEITKSSDDNNLKKKYPYYYQNLKLLSKHSPLRYAENFELIPKKTNGGSEFYNSRSKIECSEVEDNVDPIPQDLKQDGHPDDNDNNESANDDTKEKDKFSTLKNKQRLKGLGDKIDCFKVKYFGENPLDNPFFNEDIIENPEPVTKPNLNFFNVKLLKETVLDNNENKLTLSSNYSSLNQNRDEHNSNVSNLTLKEKENEKSLAHVREKRASPFTYEPYKIIKDSQIPDSKKTTTSSNISPLIKQLQSSRVVDKVTASLERDPSINKNITKIYKDIGKSDRLENRNYYSNDSSIPSFVDVNMDQRRGEPRYEIRPRNHKSQYSPVEHKRAMSVDDFKVYLAKDSEEETKLKNVESTTPAQLKRSKRRKPTSRPYFDVSQYLPPSIDTQHIAASNTVRKIIRSTEPTTESARRQTIKRRNNNEKEYDEYNEKEGHGDNTKTIPATTTTKKPTIRIRTRGTTTTSKPIEINNASESPKLQLVTRFRDHPIERTITRYGDERPLEKIYDNERNSPKYSEKKRKSTKSTLVTDTKSYGEEDDDDTRKEVDDLIGVKHDMEEYIPLYERVVNKINRMKIEDLSKRREHNYDSDIGSYGDNINEDKFRITDDDDEEDEEEEEEEEEDDDDDEHYNRDNNDDEDEDEVEEKEEEPELDEQIRLEITTSEPTKRTLAKTTEAPATTTESRSAKLELKPVISKTKIEIHKEIPVNKSSPHVTQFKQDIKEIEIIKELSTPKKKSNKNVEALDLYRDEKLAEEINKLGDVEVFRENLNLKDGPKHGGNYRSITPEELQKEMGSVSQPHIQNKGDVQTSQSETKKIVQLKEQPARRGGRHSNPRSLQKSNPERNAKFVELRETYDSKPPPLHGGNLKLPQTRNQRRKSEKYVEIDDEDEDDSSSMHGGNFKSYGNSRNTGQRMHGGNYRSAKLVKPDNIEQKQSDNRPRFKEARVNAAALLSSYARAVPVLTTTAPYILDPSKRMYYFVDA